MLASYNREDLEPLVQESVSYTDMAKKMGYTYPRSGFITRIRRRVEAYGIDTSHFLSFNQWVRVKGISHTRKHWTDLLILGTVRIDTKRLRRCMIDSGIPYTCNKCKMEPIWNSESLVIEVDHINQNPLDNRRENLQFLCPNCHSQKPIFK